MPPIKYGAFFIAIFIMKGPSIAVANVKNSTARANENPVIEKSSSRRDATNSPIVLASIDRVVRTKNLIIAINLL
jgi:hypothetical protein